MGAVRPMLAAIALLSALAAGCASIPRGEYGVDALEIEGADALSDEAIARCLLTMERDRFGLRLGLSKPECESPPFDRSAPSLSLWRWPWTDWPTLNVAVVEVDRQRIERFYRARGFYDARVLAIRYEPEAAADPSLLGPDPECDPSRDECTVRVAIVVAEGAPMRVGNVRVEGLDGLTGEARARVADAALPVTGERFDELDYDRGKRELVDGLAEASYAAAEVEGHVQLDHERKLAHVVYAVRPGAPYRFGEVLVSGQGELPASPIVGAAGIERGSPYRQSALRDVQHEVYALGAFSSVEVERVLDHATRTAALRVAVVPLPYDAFRLGIGVTSGALQRTSGGTTESVPQWDVHLLARYERRHVLGTLGKLRIEERPRVILQAPFPDPERPKPGNTLRVHLSEPGLVEARTELGLEAVWDYGPDPFLGFERSDLILRLSAQRPFLRRSLFATVALQHDRFLVSDPAERTNEDKPVPSSYVYSFVDQELRLDLRDDPVQPRQGAHFSVLASESVRAPFSDWTLIRLLPDARVYLPLPFDMVLALRFALGALFVLDARDDPPLDAISALLGPTSYRLRGGGAQSNRGFVASELGAGREGGRRRWESSVELRLRLGNEFGVVLFYDMGDVNQGRALRFDQPNPSAGFGLRYLTFIGAIRVDLGFRLGEAEGTADTHVFGAPGALHLTLGEAF